MKSDNGSRSKDPEKQRLVTVTAEESGSPSNSKQQQQHQQGPVIFTPPASSNTTVRTTHVNRTGSVLARDRRLSPVALVDRTPSPRHQSGGFREPSLLAVAAKESTPLFHRAAPTMFTLRYSSHDPTSSDNLRDQPQRASMIVAGMSLSFREVVLVRSPPLIRVARWRPKVILQEACGFFEAGSLNAIAATSTESAEALMAVLAGSILPAEGIVLANGVPVVASTFREVVGFIGRHNTAFSELTVERNIRFSAEMRSKATSSNHFLFRDNVDTVINMLALDGTRQVSSLSKLDRMKLEIAMELVLDPPVLFLSGPARELVAHELPELIEILRRLTRYLGKTVIFTALTLPMPLYERLDNLVILGRDGHTLYSGPTNRLTSYFLSLRLAPDLLCSTEDDDTFTLSPSRRQDSHVETTLSDSPTASGEGGEGGSSTRRLTNKESDLGIPSPQNDQASIGEKSFEDTQQPVPATVVTASTSFEDSPCESMSVSPHSTRLRYRNFSPSAEGSPRAEVPASTGEAGNPSQPTGVSFNGAAHPPAGALPARVYSSSAFLVKQPSWNYALVDPSIPPNCPWLVVPDGDTALDIAALWSDFEAKKHATTRYAAAFYDSPLRAELMKKMDNPMENGTTSPDPSGNGAQEELGEDGQPISRSTKHRESEQRTRKNFAFAQMMHEPPSVFKRFFVLLSINTQRGIRHKELLVACVLLLVVFGFAAYLMSQQTQSQQGMQNLRGILFFMFWVFLELNVYFIEMMVDDVKLFLQQRESGYYGMGLWLLSTLLGFITQRIALLLPVIIFVNIVLSSLNEVLLLLALCSLAHVFLVLLVVICILNARVATLVCLCIDAYNVVFSGFLVNVKTLPVAVAKTSLLRFGYGGSVEIELSGRPSACDATVVANYTNTSSYCYTGDQYLSSQGFETDTLAENSWQLGLITLGIFIVCAIRLFFSSTYQEIGRG
jgi:ABC-type multidrug transport system ATPase subunit